MKSFEKGNSTGVFWPLILIAGLGIALTWPAIWNGWPELGHDSIYHPLWLEAFSAQFHAGEWYPRWLSDTNAGLGSPTFFYYTPLSYYLSLPWMSLWSPASRAAWHSIGLSSGFALIASGVIAYFWLIRWAGARGALWGSLIYMLAPWHMAIGLYNAGSWSSFVGFVWMPLGLLGAERLIEGRRGAVVLIAAGYSLSVLTHLPTALLFSPVLLAYPILLAPAERRIRVTFQAGCGIMLGLGMAAICLVPALMQRGDASLDAMNQGSFYDYRKFFLGADIHSIMDYKMRVLVMTISMLAAAALAYWLSRRVHKDDANRTRMLFWLGVSAVCLFFMLQPSGFLWRSVGPLAAIQFPVRFNTILTLAVAALWAGAAPTIIGRRSRQAVLLARLLWAVLAGYNRMGGLPCISRVALGSARTGKAARQRKPETGRVPVHSAMGVIGQGAWYRGAASDVARARTSPGIRQPGNGAGERLDREMGGAARPFESGDSAACSLTDRSLLLSGLAGSRYERPTITAGVTIRRRRITDGRRAGRNA